MEQEQYFFQIWFALSTNLLLQTLLKALGKGDIAEILKEKTGLNKKDIELMLTAFSQTVQQEVSLIFKSIWKADVDFSETAPTMLYSVIVTLLKVLASCMSQGKGGGGGGFCLNWHRTW